MRTQCGPKRIYPVTEERRRVVAFLRHEASLYPSGEAEVAAVLLDAAAKIEMGIHAPRKKPRPKKVRPVRIEGDVGYVMLACGDTAMIDAADAEMIGRHNWSISSRPPHQYASTRLGRIDGKAVTISMHRMLLEAPSGFEVDHINGNGLDNRRANIRLATNSQNQANQRLSRANSTGFKGVEYWPRNKKWRARIKVRGTKLNLGYFWTAEEAHEAYCKAAISNFGAFARFK